MSKPSLSGGNLRALRRSPVFKSCVRRGISTRELDATKGDRERVVILGSGWSGFVLSRELSQKKFQTVVVSPRSYFVFTPLLASTAVGTLEFRTTLESVRARRTGIEYFQGWADDVNFNAKTISVEENAIHKPKSSPWVPGAAHSLTDPRVEGMSRKKGQVFDLKYDKLVVAVGCYSQTFGTKGVRENAYFLKDIIDARKIRKRILECFETASLPTTSDALRKQLLNFAVVGGGPTGVEFAAELFDLCHEDLRKVYPTLIPYINITIYDVAPKILPMFDEKLATYALSLFRRDGIKVKTEHHIQELRPGLPATMGREQNDAGCFTLKTKQEGEVGIGMCVWSTGLMMNPFIQHALDTVHTYPTSSAILLAPTPNCPAIPSNHTHKWSLKRHPKTGGLMVNDRFQVKLVNPSHGGGEATMSDVFALGDVAVMEKSQLPATAQVANQEAKWLGKHLNAGDIDRSHFNFRNLGVMTYLGNMKAIMQTEDRTEIKGRTAWIIWRGAYLTQTISWRNKLLIPIYWSVPSSFLRFLPMRFPSPVTRPRPVLVLVVASSDCSA